MQSQFSVIIDSCVLYSAPVRDLLLQLSSVGLFRAKWTKDIQEEWVSNLLNNRPDLKKSSLEKTCKLMNNSILDCMVEDYEELIEGLKLPDINDVHVLAAAIKSQSQVIVTFNLKDFPKEILDKYQIEAQHPDTILRYQIDLNLPIFLSCVKSVRGRLKNPPLQANEYLFSLSPYLPQTVGFIKQYSNLI